ncbi:MAG: hypothetical protein VX166_00605 [Pseudomonadota bacterium]|nr:hypothetical protein [Pseudomonadota bacterium]MEC8332164.1 hypothetical protein [Pseudomonadota bacterium]MEC8429971.1 hypothetical protein [Pseudomonadota bacterium]MEC8472008.1 hypothetical protein [Pseudomonadota bacterium]
MDSPKPPSNARIAAQCSQNVLGKMVNSGAVVAILTVKQPLMTSMADRLLIFSLLNVRKKTAAIIAGLAIGATCLWAISTWQNISREELIDILLASLLMLGGVMVTALVSVAGFKLVVRLIKRMRSENCPSSDQG